MVSTFQVCILTLCIIIWWQASGFQYLQAFLLPFIYFHVWSLGYSYVIIGVISLLPYFCTIIISILCLYSPEWCHIVCLFFLDTWTLLLALFIWCYISVILYHLLILWSKVIYVYVPPVFHAFVFVTDLFNCFDIYLGKENLYKSMYIINYCHVDMKIEYMT